MAELTAEQIAQRAFDLSLLDERQLQTVWGEFGRRNVPAEDFVQLVLRREYMTNFQLERLLRGEKSGYFYGDYKVLYLVAGGSFARVYRAIHKDSGKMVALKVLRKRYSDSKEQTEHFCREAWVGNRLRHPNVVHVSEVYSKGLTHFFVMEFVEGRNLREFLKVRKKLEPVEATRLSIGMASGLTYAAKQGVTHRDLKLTNILISSKGESKLVDFGLAATDASLADEADGEAPNARTIDYAGLERATGVRKDDARSDIYFAGCMYYHMLVGKPPLSETRDRIHRLARSRFFDVVPIHQVEPNTPRVVCAVVNTAMQLDPDKRYQAPAEMLVDLNIAMERLTTGDSAVGVGQDTERADVGVNWQADRLRLATAVGAVYSHRSVLIVESNVKLQDVFRDTLKKAGYRVLVISDPPRALARFTENSRPADCVVFFSGQLCEEALRGFQQFATGEHTSAIPCVLFLDEQHAAWAKEVENVLGEHRCVLTMPVKMSQFLEVLARLAPTSAIAPEAGQAS